MSPTVPEPAIFFWNRQETRIPGCQERRRWDKRLLYDRGAKVNLIPPQVPNKGDALKELVKVERTGGAR